MVSRHVDESVEDYRARKAEYAATPEFKAKKRAYQREWRAVHQERLNAQARMYAALRSPDQIARKRARDLLSNRRALGIPEPTRAAPSKCEICDQTKKLVPDHCHLSGLFRGWICGACNRAIGLMKDNPHWLSAAAVYVS